MVDRQIVGIVGAGLMGHGIAQVFASSGHVVRVYDPSVAAMETLHDRIRGNLATLNQDGSLAEQVTACGTLEAAVVGADLVIEAAAEDLALKQRLFEEIEGQVPSDAILASNTSVIPISKIMAGLKRPERALGTHWWNPPFLVPLVEVISAEHTSDAAIERTMALLASLGKAPVHVRKDLPGFIGNRLQHALWRESIALVADGVCDAATVDAAVKTSFGARLAVLGPLENADLVGLDLTQAIHSYVLPALDRSTTPSPLLASLIGDGRLGFKSGVGFHEWPEERRAALRARVTKHLQASFGAPSGGDAN